MNGEVSFQRCISVKKEMLIDGSEYSDISRCSSSSDDQKLDSQLYWLRYYDNPTVVIDVLTPNGLLIQLNISRESTLYDVKEVIFIFTLKLILFCVRLIN